jgi:hypothetical protein
LCGGGTGRRERRGAAQPIDTAAGPWRDRIVTTLSVSFVLSMLLAPVAPFAAWATLRVLCDIRDALLAEPE